MPIAFRCANCTQVLKVNDNLAGKKGKCPKCGAVLVVPAAEPPAKEQEPARPAARKPRPPQPAIIEEKALPPRRRVEVEEVVETAEVAEDDDVEVVEEPAEEAPRERGKRKKKKQQKQSRALLYGLIGGGVGLLLLCAGGGVFTWWYFFSSGPGDDLRFMPDNCQMVASIRFDQLVKSESFQELKREIPAMNQQMGGEFNKEVGVAAEDIEQIFVGGTANSKDVIVVVRTKKVLDVNTLRSEIKNAKYKETKVGKYTMQESESALHPSFCVLDKKRLVMGNTNPLKAVLQRDKKPDFSANLQAAMKAADFSKTIAVAIDARSGNAAPPGALGLLGAQNDVKTAFDKTNGVVFHAQIDSSVHWDVSLVCADAAAANDVKKSLDGFLGTARNNPILPKEIKDLLNLNLKADGNKVTASNTFKVGPLIASFKQQMNPMMGRGVPVGPQMPQPKGAAPPGPGRRPPVRPR